jgi:hypothetical protein
VRDGPGVERANVVLYVGDVGREDDRDSGGVPGSDTCQR